MQKNDGESRSYAPKPALLRITGVCFAAFIFCSCFEAEEQPITPGRYYPVTDPQSNPDSATHYYEFSQDTIERPGKYRYTIVERKSPDCIVRREHGRWTVTGKNNVRTLRLYRYTYYLPSTGAYVNGVWVANQQECVTDSTPGTAYVDEMGLYEIRAITNGSFDIEACAALTQKTCIDVAVDGHNWARYRK